MTAYSPLLATMPEVALAAIRADTATRRVEEQTTVDLPEVPGDPWFWAATQTMRLPQVRPPTLGSVGAAAMHDTARRWK